MAPPHQKTALELDVDALRQELQQLAAVNQKIMRDLGNNEPPQAPSSEEVAELREENDRLRTRIVDLEARLAGEDPWEEHQKEFESLLEEKSEIIRNLHLELHEYKEGRVETQRGNGTSQEREELARLREELEQQRLQMEEDEQSLLDQAKQMEMAMAKDRAELARQRNELQRLHNEVTREIEMASRDPALRDRLMNLQRRPTEPGNAPAGRRPTTMMSMQIPDAPNSGLRPTTMQAVPQPPEPRDPKNNTNGSNNGNNNGGLFKRFFGG